MLNGFQKGRKDMAEKTFKFKIVPQQERFYNENSNWGVYTFTTTSDDIPYFMIVMTIPLATSQGC